MERLGGKERNRSDLSSKGKKKKQYGASQEEKIEARDVGEFMGVKEGKKTILEKKKIWTTASKGKRGEAFR